MDDFVKKIQVVLNCRNSIFRSGVHSILSPAGFDVIEFSIENLKILNSQDDISDIVYLECEGYAEHKFNEFIQFKNEFRSFVVVLDDYLDYNRMVAAFEAGVDGYLTKDISCRSLIESLRLITSGEKVMPSELAALLPSRSIQRDSEAQHNVDAQRNREVGSDRIPVLSDRELETFQHMIWGEPNKIIAMKLGISEATVKVHVKAILRKLHLRNRTQAVAWALNSGFDCTRQWDRCESGGGFSQPQVHGSGSLDLWRLGADPIMTPV